MMAVTLCAGAARAADDDVLANLRKDHPRLMVLDTDLERTRQWIASDPQAKKWHDRLVTAAEKVIGEPPAEHKLVGPRLLGESRKALGRIALCAGLYRLDGDKRFAERAAKELRAVCAFPDWNPSHFLDVAEMTNACALGYDWLYDYLSPEDRATVRKAIIEFGLKPGLGFLETRTGFTRNQNNWSQVCNGGLTVGALAIADEDPEIARRIVVYCREAIRSEMTRFLAPDGGCREGPGYWNYATIYTAYYLSALKTALATDFGYTAAPGLADGGEFQIHSIGPVRKVFNYADCGENAGAAPQMMLFAAMFDRPAYARHERAFVGDNGGIFDLFWGAAAPAAGEATGADTATSRPAALSLDRLFRGVDVVYFRSAWDDRNAIYVGFKGGDNAASHGHLDLGTFVLDALGERWAVDLGGDDYNLPGYWDTKKTRWTYYRLSTPGHNTVTLNGANQAFAAKAPIIAYKSTPDLAYAVTNLTRTHPTADRFLRGVGLFQRNRVLVQDEISLRDPADVAWQMHTRADVKAEGTHATLTQNGKTLHAYLQSPPDAKFEVLPVDPASPNAKNPGVKKLAVRVKTAGPVRISVLFDPSGVNKPFLPQDLERWVDESPTK
jgi:hypothetical protein